MNALIQAALERNRTVLSLLAFLLLAGLKAYLTIPVESTPDIKIPIMYVSVTYHGISPQDSERLLLRPLEQNLRSIEGIKEMSSVAYEGGGYLLLEFRAGLNSDKAYRDVLDKVKTSQKDLPSDADEATVEEVNLSLFPVLVVKLAGPVPKRTLYQLARTVKEALESRVSSILKAEIVGDQDEVVNIFIDPMRLESTGITTSHIINFFKLNNLIIPAGKLRGVQGEFSIKVPGLLENIKHIENLPILEQDGNVVLFKEIAQVSRTFKDPQGYARDKGQSAVALEISKRTGENLIQTIEKVRGVVSELSKEWPAHLKIEYSQDQSHHIRDMLSDLQNNIISAILLVMAVIVFSLGGRSALLVGVAVPGSFLTGVLVIHLMGLTLNVVVLFSLILSVGMLVDGAIIVVEYADRRMTEGILPRQAYLEAAQRMAWPVITSTATILVVFLPLLFWPGTVGQFMRYLPITLIATLSASLLMALFFIPALGQIFGKSRKRSLAEADMDIPPFDLKKLPGFTGGYIRILERCLDHPKRVLIGAVILLIGVKMIHGYCGKGIEFFPSIEPEMSSVVVHARGNLSLEEKLHILERVEQDVLPVPFFKSVYTRVGKVSQQSDQAEDVIGSILVEFIDWQQRPKVHQIMETLEQHLKSIPGVTIEVENEKQGPGNGKPIQIQLSSHSLEQLEKAGGLVRGKLSTMEGITAVEDTRSIPSLAWKIDIDRTQAAKFKTDINMISEAVQLVTEGLTVSNYRPDDSTQEIDMKVRLPQQYRTLDELDRIRITNDEGSLIPLSLFVKRVPQQETSFIKRVNAKRSLTIKADVKPGVIIDNKVQELRQWLVENPLSPDIELNFKGEDEDQKETGAFLVTAFLLAIALIALILVTQFNSFFSAALVLSAVVMSTIGVMVGLLITGQAFGIVMGGIGVIALAGIIVSNNIILIDTFDLLSQKMSNTREAIILTCAQRLRPVILTKLTTILGLLPIMFSLTLDFMGGSITYGAPSTQWWVQLSSTIVYGVIFASILTLLVTPSALMVRANYQARRQSPKGM